MYAMYHWICQHSSSNEAKHSNVWGPILEFYVTMTERRNFLKPSSNTILVSSSIFKFALKQEVYSNPLFFSINIIKIYLHVCVCTKYDMFRCQCSPKKEGIRSPGAKFTDSCKHPDITSGNHAVVPGRAGSALNPWAISSAPTGINQLNVLAVIECTINLCR